MATKRFQCRYCDAQFNRSEHYKRHERSHTGEKPFTCVICGMSFVRNDLMLRHGRLKHKTNLSKLQQQQQLPQPTPVDTLATPSPSSEINNAFTSVLPDQLETSSTEIDQCFTALDPALYAPWPLPDLNPPHIPASEPSPAVPIPDTYQLLMENGFRDVLLKAAQAMPQKPKIPSSTSLNRYVSLFLEKFDPHSPFLPPTFSIDTANPLLLTSIASIGALYGMERKTALMLHSIAKNLEENLRGSLGCEDYPLWGIQSLYLSSVFAAWSGFAKGAQYAISHMPILAMLCKSLYRHLSKPTDMMEYDEWMELETLRRTYFCVYMFSGSITLIYACPPVVTTVDARGLILPCSSEDWKRQSGTSSWTPPTSTLYDEAMMALWSGQPITCSPFGIRILATSVFLEIWQAQHGHGSWLPEDWKERHYIVLQCLQDHIGTVLSQCAAEESEPLIWNAIFVLYGCYARLANETTFVEEAFCHSNGPAICQALKVNYAHFSLAQVDLRSVRSSLNGFTDIVGQGLKFIGHTGCFSRGLEHALGGFHSGTLLVQWVRSIEEKSDRTPEEKELLDQLRRLLEEGDVHIYPESLAATLARSSTQLMDQVWIWGITPLMGEALRLYAEEILGSRAAIMDVEPVLLEDEQRSEYGD